MLFTYINFAILTIFKCAFIDANRNVLSLLDSSNATADYFHSDDSDLDPDFVPSGDS